MVYLFVFNLITDQYVCSNYKIVEIIDYRRYVISLGFKGSIDVVKYLTGLHVHCVRSVDINILRDLYLSYRVPCY